MAATGKTPILLYGSTTASNVPVAGNLTNSSDGCEIAINVADKNLFFKDSSNNVNTVPIRQSSASSDGWLSSTDWSTFNGKASTSSPTFSGNVTLSTGNLVIGTSGKGIDFSATAGTGTSELLADYEEGTFTLTATPFTGSITLSNNTMRYTKIGRMIYIQGFITVTSVSSPNGFVTWGGLPYAASSGSESWSSILMADNLAGKTKGYVSAGSSTITYSYYNDTAIAQDITSSYTLVISGCYST